MDSRQLPLLICGPILRRTFPDRIVLWWIASKPLSGRFECFAPGRDQSLFYADIDDTTTRSLKIGMHAHVQVFDTPVTPGLPEGLKINYNLVFDIDSRKVDLKELLPDLAFQGETLPCFVIKTQIDKLLHGSCRNPHYHSDDSMIGAEKEIKNALSKPDDMPALLMLTGDQIYADDVAGPMLRAIHQTIRLLGLNHEQFTGSEMTGSQELFENSDTYYAREKILPRTKVGKGWYNKGGRHPVFTSFFAHNHLITFAEFMAMYILVWSKAMWELLDLSPKNIQEQFKSKYEKERTEIEKFVDTLPSAQRVLAHIPCYMIFDDHDITDDWNMTAQWEIAAYENPSPDPQGERRPETDQHQRDRTGLP